MMNFVPLRLLSLSKQAQSHTRSFQRFALPKNYLKHFLKNESIFSKLILGKISENGYFCLVFGKNTIQKPFCGKSNLQKFIHGSWNNIGCLLKYQYLKNEDSAFLL